MLFNPTKPEKVLTDQLYEARRLFLEHAASAEHHKALADMYEKRVERLMAIAPTISMQVSAS